MASNKKLKILLNVFIINLLYSLLQQDNQLLFLLLIVPDREFLHLRNKIKTTEDINKNPIIEITNAYDNDTFTNLGIKTIIRKPPAATYNAAVKFFIYSINSFNFLS